MRVLLYFAGLTSEQLFLGAYVLGIPVFMFLIFSFNLIHSRRHGFKRGEDLDFILQGQGEPLFYYRIASMGAGWSRYKNCLKITGYRDYLHVKLMLIFGGGVLLLPMSEAEISYRTTLFGKMALVDVEGRRFTFAPGVTAQIRKHYDKSVSE